MKELKPHKTGFTMSQLQKELERMHTAAARAYDEYDDWANDLNDDLPQMRLPQTKTPATGAAKRRETASRIQDIRARYRISGIPLII